MKTPERQSLRSELIGDLRTPGHIALVVVGFGVFAVSILPGVLSYTARADAVGLFDAHYLEHMVMELGGLLVGFAFSPTFARRFGARTRMFGLGLIVLITAVDMAAMTPAVDLFADRTPLLHAGIHSLLFLTNIPLGAAWGAVVGSSFWAFILLAVLMMAMVIAGGP